jgi:hypothetical protein
VVEVIARLVDDRAVLTGVMRAATGRPQAGLVGGVVVDAGGEHALIIRSAFTALPLEFLDVEPATDLVRLFDRRAKFARFLIDLAPAHVPFGHPRDAAV